MEGELEEDSVSKESLLTASDGKKYITRFYNLDVKKFNAQYRKIQLKKNYSGHDRFLIIDETIYHVGGSMKDLGNRLMAYSILSSVPPDEIIEKITNR